jgi:glycosyltransferase involved in cell wall biosynthesis
MPPFVSFVIPTYNRARHIEQAIRSALDQTDPDLEVIVVDDGSTDDTAQVVQSISDVRVRYLRKENGERGAARNFGVRHALGTYVYYLDSDDVVTREHVSHARGLLDSLGRPEVMHSRFERVHTSDRALRQLPSPESPDQPAGLLRRLLRRNVVGCYLFVRRDIALLHPFIEDRRFNVGEDWYIALVLGSRYPIFATKLTTRAVVTHAEQTMQNIPPERCLLAANFLTEHLSKDAHFMREHRSALPGIRAEMTTLAALQYALIGERRRALTTLAEAASFSPRAIMDRRALAILKHALRRRRGV